MRGKHKISDKWEATVHVVVRRAGTLPVYTVKPENREGPLRTLHRDLLLPCGYLPTEDGHPVPQSRKRGPSTRANPSPDETTPSDEEEDVVIPIYWFRDPSSVQVPTFQSAAQFDPWVSPEQDTQRQILPLDQLVESSPSVQRVDYLPEIDKQPSRLDCTTDIPLILDQPDSQPSDIEHSTTDIATTAEPMGSTENDSPDTECDKLPDVPGDTGDNETIGTCTSDTHEHEQVSSVRRSTRTKDQPKRLTYTELGSPLLAMMQSFLLGLSTVVDTALNENSVGSTSSTSQIVTTQPLSCPGTCMSSGGESVAQAS